MHFLRHSEWQSEVSDLMNIVENALAQEVKVRDEVIAWRNRFPDHFFVPGQCRIVLRPDLKTYNCHPDIKNV